MQHVHAKRAARCKARDLVHPRGILNTFDADDEGMHEETGSGEEPQGIEVDEIWFGSRVQLSVGNIILSKDKRNNTARSSQGMNVHC